MALKKQAGGKSTFRQDGVGAQTSELKKGVGASTSSGNSFQQQGVTPKISRPATGGSTSQGSGSGTSK